MPSTRFLAIFFITFLLPLPATADVSLWKKVGDWDISFYSSSRGCLGMANYEGGITYFTGFSLTASGLMFEVTLMNEEWKSIEEGKEYTVTVKFGNERPWTLDMYGRQFGDFPGLAFSIDANAEQSGRFVDEFKREVSMTWTYDGVQLGFLNLRGSRRAFDEIVSCQRSFNEAISSVSDPFSAGGQTDSRDPFQ